MSKEEKDVSKLYLEFSEMFSANFCHIRIDFQLILLLAYNGLHKVDVRAQKVIV